MSLARSINLGAWLIVIINLLMAFGAIGIFTRMAPAIENILQKNAISLRTCETMLAQLALAKISKDKNEISQKFKAALINAKNNISEKNEAQIIEDIEKHYVKALSGEQDATRITVEKLRKLSNINYSAMSEADSKAKQLGGGGAWAIVFMALIAFVSGVIFIHQITHKLLIPIKEIKMVLIEHLNGETRRRCTGIDLPGDIRSIYGNLNQVLDRSMHNSFDD
ncbi:MAG: hypothetical protein ACQETH_12855 [Candidatus Rifleibacteriota bacterium]